MNSEETIYFTSNFETIYDQLYFTHGSVLNGLIASYLANDLRYQVFYRVRAGNFVIKGVNGASITSPFTGLATDEIYLIKAECLARNGQTAASMNVLNELLIKRWNPNATSPSMPYENLTAISPEAAIDKILLERKKRLSIGI